MNYIFVIIAIVIISFFIDVYLIKRNRKADGQIIVTIKEDGKKLISLELDIDPDDIAIGEYILFKVVDEPTEDF